MFRRLLPPSLLAFCLLNCGGDDPSVGPTTGASENVPDDRDDRDGGPGADANVDAGTSSPPTVVPPSCDMTKAPKDSPACITDTVGVFVSPNGNDSGAGTKASPLKTINEALKRDKPRVYVCDGTYDAPVEVKRTVGIFGGLTCGWIPEAVKPRIAPPHGVALRVTKVDAAVLIQDVEVYGSADPAKPSDSAIGVFLSESTKVTLRNLRVVANDGNAGANGTNGSNHNGQPASRGGNASASFAGMASKPGKGLACMCADGTSSTGGYGLRPLNAVEGPPSGSAVPSVGEVNFGFSSSGPGTCAPGRDGANGLGSTGGGSGGTAGGSLEVTSWRPSPRPTRASNGNPGQGGGGGGGGNRPTGGVINDRISDGGGGGCGGCGGGGGEAGFNGGSSFALLSFQSDVTIDGGNFSSGSGGTGGRGGNGQAGQAGGGGGSGTCAGGIGGYGGGGSGGGGGAGGHSVVIGYEGKEPTLEGATLTAGAPGAAGSGGAPTPSTGNPGVAGASGEAGLSQQKLQL